MGDTNEKQQQMRAVLDVMDRLQLSRAIDRHLGQHGLHLGLSNGEIATLWLLCIMCEGEQRKSAVKEWVRVHQAFLEEWLQQPLRPVEFSDSRLGILLHRLSGAAAWTSLEEDLWRRGLGVSSRHPAGVYVTSLEFPNGRSGNGNGATRDEDSRKDRRGKQQIKLSVATVEPSGQLMACDVHPVTLAPLQRQMFLSRVQQLIGHSGLTYVLDNEMCTLPMRAQIVAGGGNYTAKLFSGEWTVQLEAAEVLDDTIRQAAQGDLSTLPLHRQGHTVGMVAEREVYRAVHLGDLLVEWPERIQAIRFLDIARRETAALAQNVEQAEAALRAIIDKPSDGQYYFANETALTNAVNSILKQYHVEGLLHVSWAKREERRISYVGRGRGGPNRPTRETVYTYYALTGVQRDQEAIERQRERLGWQIRVTSLPMETLSLEEAVERSDRDDLKREARAQKALPLSGLGEMHVHRTDQVVGMMRLLLLACRLQGLVGGAPMPAREPRAASSFSQSLPRVESYAA